MAKILPIPKRLTQQQAHDYVITQHHRDDFDHKAWWKSVAWFWLGIAAFMFIIAIADYVTNVK